MRDDSAFRAFVEENGATLLHAARLLTGDHQRGEDLVQTVLIKVYLKWGRIDAPLAYARKALVTAQIDSSRRRWWGERPAETLPEVSGADELEPAEDRDQLRRLLTQLSPRERAVVVLRYYEQLSERETADALGVSVGTVKSQASRALGALRTHLGDRDDLTGWEAHR